MENGLNKLSEKGIVIKLNNEKYLGKSIIIDLPNNEKGILMTVFEYRKIQDPRRFCEHRELDAFDVKTPIIKLDGSIYDLDFLKLGTLHKFSNPNIIFTRDQDSLYVAVSYEELSVTWDSRFDNKCRILKYRLPNLDLIWEKSYGNMAENTKDIYSLTVNESELAMYDCHSSNILFCDKFTGNMLNKYMEGPSHSSSTHSTLMVTMLYRHELAFFKQQLLTMSERGITLHDKDLNELMAIFHDNAPNFFDGESMKKHIEDYFANGGIMEKIKADNLNNRIFFISRRSIMVLNASGIQKIPIFADNVYDIEIDPTTGDLLVKIIDNNENQQLIVLDAEQLDGVVKKGRSKSKLTPFTRLLAE